MPADNYARWHKGHNGQYYFKVYDGANHRVIAQSEGYKNKTDCIETARSLTRDQLVLQEDAK